MQARSVETYDARGNVSACFDAFNHRVEYEHGAFDHLETTSFEGVQTLIQSDPRRSRLHAHRLATYTQVYEAAPGRNR